MIVSHHVLFARTRAIALVAVGIILPSSWSSIGFAQQVTTLVVAHDGMASPDGNGSLAGIARCTLNESGQVTFISGITGSTNNTGIFRSDSGTLALIAREGQAAPDGNGKFAHFEGATAVDPIPLIDSAGRVVFLGQLEQTIGGSDDDRGIFRGDGHTLVTIARDGSLGPATSVQQPTINRSGEIAFRVGSPSNSGIFRANNSDIVQICQRFQPAPGGNGTFDNILEPAISDSGAVAFSVDLLGTSGGASDNRGIYRGNGAQMVQIVRKGAAVPGGNGVFASLSDDPQVNGSGQVLFTSAIAGSVGGNNDNVAIYRGDGVGITEIVRKGQPSPDGNGIFSSLGTNVIDDRGAVAFVAGLRATSGGASDDQGLFYDDGTDLELIAREGQIVPGGNGKFSTVGLPASNNRGQFAFTSSLTGTAGGAADDFGLFFYDPQVGLTPRARERPCLGARLVKYQSRTMRFRMVMPAMGSTRRDRSPIA